ncbi:hypothetical protein AAF712_011447, partial [Marasmius tenuissimus]
MSVWRYQPSHGGYKCLVCKDTDLYNNYCIPCHEDSKSHKQNLQQNDHTHADAENWDPGSKITTTLKDIASEWMANVSLGINLYIPYTSESLPSMEVDFSSLDTTLQMPLDKQVCQVIA